MRNAPMKMQTGTGLSSDNLNGFTLTELSLLIKIINEIAIIDIYEKDDKSIIEIISTKRIEVLKKVGLSEDDPNLSDFNSKISNMINYFENDLRIYQDKLTEEINKMSITSKLQFINKRLVDYRNLLNNNDDDYAQFVSSYGLDKTQLPSTHEQISNIIPFTLANIWNKKEFNQLLQYLQNISQKEKNLFHFYKLHLLTRTLIMLFIKDWTNFYNIFLSKVNSQISILSFTLMLDELELEANSIYDLLTNQITIFNFIQNNQENIKTLQEEETIFTSHFHVLFQFESSVNIINNLINYIPLIYTFTKSTDRTDLTCEQIANFAPSLISIRPNTYNLYHLYFSKYVSKQNGLKEKLEEYYINPQLIAQMTEQLNKNSLKYNINLKEYIQLKDGTYFPPQIREIIIQNNVEGASSSHQIKSVDNSIHFSLTELSFLACILNSIKIDELKKDRNDFEFIIQNYAIKILNKFNLEDNPFLLESFDKIIELINKYKNNLDEYIEGLTQYISNVLNSDDYKKSFREDYILFEDNDGQEEQRNWVVGFIARRNSDRLKIISIENYHQVINLNSDIEELNDLSEEVLEDYLNTVKYPIQKEKNLFIFYNLLAQTKILINLYLNNSINYNNYYLKIDREKTYAKQFLNKLEKLENDLYNLLANLTIYTEFNNNYAVLRPFQLENYLAPLVSFGFNNKEIKIEHYFPIIKSEEAKNSKQEGKSSRAGGSGRSYPRGDKKRKSPRLD